MARPQTCVQCGGRVSASRGPVTIAHRGEMVVVPDVEQDVCESCGESFLSPETVEYVQREAAAQVRRNRGLLQPNEIKALRESLGYSQAAFEKLLRVGPKTVIRWEKGTVVQSATADLLMQLVRDMPEVVQALGGQQAGRRRPSSEASRKANVSRGAAGRSAASKKAGKKT